MRLPSYSLGDCALAASEWMSDPHPATSASAPTTMIPGFIGSPFSGMQSHPDPRHSDSPAPRAAKSTQLFAPPWKQRNGEHRQAIDAPDNTHSVGYCWRAAKDPLHWWAGAPVEQGLMRFPLPGGGGHEYAGVVDEVGSAVTRVKPGDRVVVDLFESTSCGACPQCAAGLYGQCEQRRFFGIGGFVDYLKTTDRGLYKLPEGVETRTAAVVEPCACAVSGKHTNACSRCSRPASRCGTDGRREP